MEMRTIGLKQHLSTIQTETFSICTNRSDFLCARWEQWGQDFQLVLWKVWKRCSIQQDFNLVRHWSNNPFYAWLIFIPIFIDSITVLDIARIKQLRALTIWKHRLPSLGRQSAWRKAYFTNLAPTTLTPRASNDVSFDENSEMPLNLSYNTIKVVNMQCWGSLNHKYQVADKDYIF